MKLKIENVSKKFKDVYAVNSVSAELTEGVYALLGPNGSGKTTFMRMIASVSKPTSGRILYNGQDVIFLDEKYRDLLGYLPQEFGLYRNFTAERFLNYFASLKGFTKEEGKKRVDEVLEMVNLSAERKKKTKNFSGGMKRRLGIAQALLNDPKILIVDEPTAGLDPKERIRFRNLLSDISRDRIVIFSTHIVSDIEFIAKDILIIDKGVLREQNDVDGLLRNMEGKVWKVHASEAQLPKFQELYKIGNIQRKKTGIELRVISKNKPTDDATQLEAALEDVYLYYFGAGADVHV